MVRDGSAGLTGRCAKEKVVRSRRQFKCYGDYILFDGPSSEQVHSVNLTLSFPVNALHDLSDINVWIRNILLRSPTLDFCTTNLVLFIKAIGKNLLQI
jgi:hypothetical protein